MLEQARSRGVRPDDKATVLIELGRAALGAGDPATARRQFEQALEIEPQAPQAHANLGLCRMLQNDPETAARHYRDALALAPNEPTINRMLSQALLQPGPQRDPAAARDAARRAARLAPRDPDAWESLARSCDALGDARGAAEARLQLTQLAARARERGR